MQQALQIRKLVCFSVSGWVHVRIFRKHFAEIIPVVVTAQLGDVIHRIVCFGQKRFSFLHPYGEKIARWGDAECVLKAAS